jgi:hypothetical protein
MKSTRISLLFTMELGERLSVMLWLLGVLITEGKTTLFMTGIEI